MATSDSNSELRAASSTAPKTPVARPLSMVDQVTDAILKLILAGELPAGQAVAIRDLSERLGVSHIPVRESLRRLESRGLVNFRRGRRPEIAPVDPQDFEDLFRLRSVIEADVASRSAKLLTADRIAVLEHLFSEMQTVIVEGSPSLAYPLHTNFHLALLPGASRWDRQMLEQLWVATERYIQLYLTGVERDAQIAEGIVESHRELMDVAGHATARNLRRATLEHIRYSYDTIMPVILTASGQQ